MRMGYWQAAEYLGIKVATLRSLVCRKQIPHIRLTPRLVVFDSDALDAHIAANSVQTGAQQ
jgi:excisionase family DNA binding protein